MEQNGDPLCVGRDGREEETNFPGRWLIVFARD
jgi:hypothetical protein